MARKQKRKKSSKGGIIAISLVVMMLFTVMAFKSMELREKNEAYIEREKSLMEQIAAEEQRQLDLAEYEK